MTTKHEYGKNAVSMEVGRYLRQRVSYPLKSKRQCARDSGLSPNSVSYVEKIPVVRTFMQKNLIDAGVDHRALAEKIKELLDAEHPYHKDAKGKYRPDNSNRMKAVVEAGKMLDAYPATKIDIHKREEKFQVSIEASMRAEGVTGETLTEPENVEPIVEAV